MKRNYLFVFLALLTTTGCVSSRYKFYDDENYSILSTNQQTPNISFENVKSVNIDWLDGVIYFKTSEEVNDISIYEDFYDYKPVKSEYARYNYVNGTLDIKFSKSNVSILDEISKDLYVLVPESYTLESIYVNSVSSNISIDDVKIKTVKIAQVSGTNTIKCKLHTDSIEIKSVSANTDIYFDELESFTIMHSTTSGKFTNEFVNTSKEDPYSYTYSAFDSHICFINVTSTSGNLNIKKYE